MAFPGAFEQLSELAKGTGPVLVMLVGPNGAGKSTFFERRLSSVKLPFINADHLAKTLIESGAPTGEATERMAAELADKRRREMVEKHESFITESVFSDPVGAKVTFLREAQIAGYAVVLIFICVESPELSSLRVKSRVLDGGHDVPPDKIAPRYKRMRANVRTALTFVDLAIVVDNSSFEVPLRPVATTARGKIIDLGQLLPWWAKEVLPDAIKE